MTALLALILLALIVIIALLATPQDERGAVLWTTIKVLGVLAGLRVAYLVLPFVAIAGYYMIHRRWFIYIFGSLTDPETLWADFCVCTLLVIGAGLGYRALRKTRNANKPSRQVLDRQLTRDEVSGLERPGE
jgi:hypothetical protein